MTAPPPDPALTRAEFDAITRLVEYEELRLHPNNARRLLAHIRRTDEALREIENRADANSNEEAEGGIRCGVCHDVAETARASRLRESKEE